MNRSFIIRLLPFSDYPRSLEKLGNYITDNHHDCIFSINAYKHRRVQILNTNPNRELFQCYIVSSWPHIKSTYSCQNESIVTASFQICIGNKKKTKTKNNVVVRFFWFCFLKTPELCFLFLSHKEILYFIPKAIHYFSSSTGHYNQEM